MNKWINVDDQMPTEGEDVLIWEADDDKMHVARWEIWGIGGSGWLGLNDNTFYPVTHWMPLPEGPV